MDTELFEQEDLSFFEPDGKVGLLAVKNPEGLPHISLITAMQGCGRSRLIFGQFCEGRSKTWLQERPEAGFLLMTLDRKIWTGKARWVEKKNSGPEHELMNRKPMWRYNAYFGIHTVHYLDLVGVSRCRNLPLGRVAAGLATGLLCKLFSRPYNGERIMNRWTEKFIAKPGNLKFLAWIDRDGYPRIVPQLGAISLNSASVLVPGIEYFREIATIPEGVSVALFAMALSMEDVLVRGIWRRHKQGGRLEVNWVYNSMPPVAEQIYPPVPLNAKVTVF
ncbi:MAG: hypothetical protein KKI09_02210 [Spirochaetes bacterium]|nr:hypothetical protein [Spirochaetota bacterium]MBU0954218.1 hypothetical protein [Spirochaetota bacterium]